MTRNVVHKRLVEKDECAINAISENKMNDRQQNVKLFLRSPLRYDLEFRH
jgi:hypothetical protein